MRVLHSPNNIGNQPWTLSRAERDIGLKSDLVVNYSTWTQYPADKILSAYQSKSPVDIIRRWVFGLTAPFRYNVMHYYFGRSVLYFDDLPSQNRWPFLDLKIAKKLGRPVFMTLQGCDARLAGESNKNNAYTPCSEGRCVAYATCIATLDAQRRKLIAEILPLCDRVFYLNPELGHFVPEATFMPYANVDIDDINFEPPIKRERPIIVHAPSDPNIKGTKLILASLEKLKEKYDFDLVLVEGKPHKEAMAIYRSADLVIDQIFAGWYGGLSVEVMAMGKPVAATIRESDLKFVPDEMSKDIPILPIHPDTLTQDIARILDRQNEWAAIGVASRKYVERWHHPRHIARALSRIYHDPSAPFVISGDA